MFLKGILIAFVFGVRDIVGMFSLPNGLGLSSIFWLGGALHFLLSLHCLSGAVSAQRLREEVRDLFQFWLWERLDPVLGLGSPFEPFKDERLIIAFLSPYFET